MVTKPSLNTVSSEVNREAEQTIVFGTLRRAAEIGRHHDINDIFVVSLEGLNDHPELFAKSVIAMIRHNIEAEAASYGLGVTHWYSYSCEFMLLRRKLI